MSHRLMTEPPMRLDPTMPEIRLALDRIRLEMLQVEHEFPDWTPHQIMREARRRCAPATVAAVDAMRRA